MAFEPLFLDYRTLATNRHLAGELDRRFSARVDRAIATRVVGPQDLQRLQLDLSGAARAQGEHLAAIGGTVGELLFEFDGMAQSLATWLPELAASLQTLAEGQAQQIEVLQRIHAAVESAHRAQTPEGRAEQRLALAMRLRSKGLLEECLEQVDEGLETLAYDARLHLLRAEVELARTGGSREADQSAAKALRYAAFSNFPPVLLEHAHLIAALTATSLENWASVVDRAMAVAHATFDPSRPPWRDLTPSVQETLALGARAGLVDSDLLATRRKEVAALVTAAILGNGLTGLRLASLPLAPGAREVLLGSIREAETYVQEAAAHAAGVLTARVDAAMQSTARTTRLRFLRADIRMLRRQASSLPLKRAMQVVDNLHRHFAYLERLTRDAEARHARLSDLARRFHAEATREKAARAGIVALGEQPPEGVSPSETIKAFERARAWAADALEDKALRRLEELVKEVEQQRGTLERDLATRRLAAERRRAEEDERRRREEREREQQQRVATSRRKMLIRAMAAPPLAAISLIPVFACVDDFSTPALTVSEESLVPLVFANWLGILVVRTIMDMVLRTHILPLIVLLPLASGFGCLVCLVPVTLAFIGPAAWAEGMLRHDLTPQSLALLWLGTTAVLGFPTAQVPTK